MRSIFKILIGVFTIILLSNFIPSAQIGTAYNFQTQNKEFVYRSVPTKGSGVPEMEKTFTKFKAENPQHNDLILYRTFNKKWWKFWKWGSYFTGDIWSYPYMK
ncbi:MAG: hypothetical protein P1U56_07850 [Saprospiraceae bacterium]|nr:hypothetical protein [Saprospiraceae bacterium]